MKLRLLFFPLFVVIALAIFAVRTNAQSPGATGTPQHETPEGRQPEAMGEVTGSLVNLSPGGKIPETASIMLHVLGQNFEQLGMLHSELQPDGTFVFEDVPLDRSVYYSGIVTYQGATYYSQPIPYNGETSPDLEIPIYESTNDLSKVQVDEMHVLFNFASDGLEVNEIYLLSNYGEYTITGTLTLTDGQPATIEYPLPSDADYIFFKPDTADRFVTLDEGFADKAPLIPGKQTSSIMVSYLVPYTDDMSYSFTAPVPVQNIDYFLPAEQEMLLDGPNLSGPELKSLQDNSVYEVYSYSNLPKGQSIQFSFLGTPKIEGSDSQQVVTKPAVSSQKIAIIGAISTIGLAMIGVGVWQWRKTRDDDSEVEADNPSDNSRLDAIIGEIAQLDEAKDRGEINAEEHQQRRESLRNQAKAILDEKDDGL